MDSNAEKTGGYDCKFVDTPPDKLICQICLLVARSPRQVTCCGRVYCEGCLCEQKKHSSICPNCRTFGLNFPDIRGEQEIKSLKVKCSNNGNGCCWMGELRSLDNHLTTCGYTLIPCTNKCMYNTSKVYVLRRDLDSHLKNKCPNRQYQCRQCMATGRYCDITTTHLNTCPKVKIPCPSMNCMALVPRFKLLDHLTTCEYALLHCPNKCMENTKEVRILRRDLDHHLKDKCPNRQYQCAHCKAIGKYHDMTTTHLDTCPKVKTPCPNTNCKASVSRCELADHRSKCEFEKVPCKYAGIGCKNESLRKDLQQHENDDTFHLHLAIETVNKQQEEISEQWEEINEQREEINEQREEINKQQEEINEQREEINEQREEINKQQEEINEQQEEINEQREEINKQQEEISEQREEINEQREETNKQQEEITEQREEINEQREEINKQQEEISEQREEINKQWAEINKQREEMNKQRAKMNKQREKIDEQQKEIKEITEEQKIMSDTIIASQAGPCVFKMPKFSLHKPLKQEWCSPPFYTHPGGYKMCIEVDANGSLDGKGTHVSVFAHLMKGKNDDNLPWPFTGKVTITLLNQLADKNHYTTTTASFSQDHKASRRVVDGEMATTGYGQPKFISHNQLGYDVVKNCQYLKDDCLYFQIKVQAAKPVKPWLTSVLF